MAEPLTQCDVDFSVRYSEVDRMGVVHHSRYWVYFEMGRTELLRRQGTAYADLEREGVLLAVVKCSARFRAAAGYDEILTLTTRIGEVRLASITHQYEVRRKADGVLICTAQTTLACIDRDHRVIPLPPPIRHGP